MIVLGLTGSIGMGKSEAARMLRLMGALVHDSDKAVHDALLPGSPYFAQVAALFPAAVRRGRIDRKRLGKIVFADRNALRALEGVLHPAAQESQMKFLRAARARKKRIAVLEIPLLFETNAQARVDYTITVSSPPAIQRQRVMRRPNMTKEKFGRILESQMPDGQKKSLSDFVVDTGLGRARTFRQLKAILKTVKEKQHA